MNNSRYKIYGLIVESELPINGAVRTEQQAEVWVKFSHRATFPENAFIIDIPEIALFSVSNGTHIFIEPFTENVDFISIYLVGAVFGAILHQRGTLVIHGAAIAIDNYAIIVSGSSGSGKSTLLTYFLKKGYRFLSDDICAINIENNHVFVLPSTSQIKLFPTSMQFLAFQGEKISGVPGIDKYVLNAESYFLNLPLSIKHLFLLHPNSEKIGLNTIIGSEKFDKLALQTYRLGLVDKMKNHDSHFKQLNKLISSTNVIQVSYPNDIEQVKIVTDLLIEYIRNYGSK